MGWCGCFRPVRLGPTIPGLGVNVGHVGHGPKQSLLAGNAARECLMSCRARRGTVGTAHVHDTRTPHALRTVPDSLSTPCRRVVILRQSRRLGRFGVPGQDSCTAEVVPDLSRVVARACRAFGRRISCCRSAVFAIIRTDDSALCCVVASHFPLNRHAPLHLLRQAFDVGAQRMTLPAPLVHVHAVLCAKLATQSMPDAMDEETSWARTRADEVLSTTAVLLSAAEPDVYED